MESKTTPSLYGARDGERGAGGKFKKPPARKPPATPYDRPPPPKTPANQTPLATPYRSGWLSKLVNPAYRIISGGATMILPSFISNALVSSAATPPPPPPPPLLPLSHGDLDKEDQPTIQNVGDDEKCTSSYMASISTGEKETGPSMGKLNEISEVEKLEEAKPRNSSDDSEISRIEQLMQGKTISRDEFLRLTEMLNSRVIDEQENRASRTEGDIGRFALTHETPRRPNERKQEEINYSMPGTSTPLPQINVQDEVGASPIDIARAYMGSRRSEQGCESYAIVPKGEKAPQNKAFIPPPTPKSSTCWPGAMVQEQRGYNTPRNQRGYGLLDFPRTPYSRTILSKSRARTQLQADNRSLDHSVKPFQQSQSSIYGQAKNSTDLPDQSYGSVGPIRRIQKKFGSESRPRRSIFPNSTNASSPVEKHSASRMFLPGIGKNVDVGETSGVSKQQSGEHRVGSSEEAMPLISSSNESVRKILEQLDRHKATPAEKAAELKLASEWKKHPRTEDATPNGKIRSSPLGEFGSSKNTALAAAKSSKEGDVGRVNHVEQSQEQTTHEDDTAADASAKASSIAGGSGIKSDANTVPSFTFQCADSQVKSLFSGSHIQSSLQDSIGTDKGRKDKGATQQWPFHHQSNGQNATTLSKSTGFELPRKSFGQASGTKHNLSSISINKPNPRNAAFPENGFGFTFQVPASSGALSEPPTPSMLPSSSASVISQPVDASAVPSYSFGTEKSAQRLVFSFPSTSNSPVHVDSSDIKFNFGADKKSRLSFSAVGKATC